MARSIRPLLRLSLLIIGVASCGDAAGPEDSGIETLVEVDPTSLSLRTHAAGSLPVPFAVFLGTVGSGARIPTEAAVRSQVEHLVDGANAILEQCGLHLDVETAQAIGLPPELLDIQGNERGSSGGHPPPGTDNPAQFNYDEGNRLTEDTRRLFGYGKGHSSPNAIGLFTVRTIAYYIRQEQLSVVGLSFPPNLYHHPDDYPLRNSVLHRADLPPGGLPAQPPAGSVVAHEVAHMLLNTGLHRDEPGNLMGHGGTALDEGQCATMRANRTRLFGGDAVPDPGRPS